MPTLRFTYSAGRLVAGVVESNLKEYCFLRNYKVKINKLGGDWLSSKFGVIIETKTDKQLQETKDVIKGWMNKMERATSE